MSSSRQSIPTHGDRQFIIYIGILIIVGLAVLTSASGPFAYFSSPAHDSYFFVKRQLLFGLFPGVILFVFFSNLSHRWWRALGWLLYGTSLALLLLVFVSKFGLTVNGSRSWISLVGFTFQPAELAKFSLVVLLSILLSKNNVHGFRDPQTELLPLLIVAGIPILLVLLQGDLGSTTILGVITLVLFYVGKVPKSYVGIMVLLAAIGGMILIAVAPHRVNRVLVFVNPNLVTDQRFRYQIDQASIAVGSGGFWGLGFGNSRQKYQYLPEVTADSIFAIFAEETGFIGAVLFLGLLLLIGWRGLKIANEAPDEMSKLVVVGVITWLMWQSFLNIGGIVRALPLTGVPLPLVSHGGSAYLTMLAALGLVVGVSKQSEIRP